jgi:hypothetical protein
MGKRGLQREMDSFFREAENDTFNIRRITKESMCLLSMLYDPANYLSLEVQMGQTDGSEFRRESILLSG